MTVIYSTYGGTAASRGPKTNIMIDGQECQPRVMRDICFISPIFGRYFGGMETHSYAFAKYFQSHPEHPIRAILTKRSADATPLTSRSAVAAQKLTHPILTGRFREDARAIIRLCNFPDTILYLNSPTWLPVCAYIKREYPRARVVVRSGGNDIMAGWIGDMKRRTKPLLPARDHLVTMANTYADYFIVNSAYSFERTAALGIAPAKLVKIMGGVDCSAFAPAKRSARRDPVTILTVARLLKFKGVSHSIEAVRRLNGEVRSSLRYLIVGDGPERDDLGALARDLTGIVSFVGAKSIDEMPQYFAQADIFLHLPICEERCSRGSTYTHTETMGRSLCEAAAAALPTVASAVGGVPEVIAHGRTGYLVPEGNSQRAAARLGELVNSNTLRRAVGKSARLRALSLFDWSHVFGRHCELFE